MSTPEQNKQTVTAFYDLMFNQQKPREAIEKYVDDVYIQHNLMVADGKEAFAEYFERMHRDVMHNEGTFSPDGKIIVTFGSHVDTSAGKEVKVRSVTTFIGNDTFVTEMFYGGGSKDAKTITLTHKRKRK